MPITVSNKKKKKSKQKVAPKSQELTRLGSALRSLGGLGGGMLGGLVGMGTGGSQIGHSLGAALSKWLGSGDYTVSANSVINRTLRASSSVPAMHSQSQSVVVRHREYLGEVRSSTSFTVQNAFSINPGNGQLFPWLSRIASGFQEYSIKGMVFHYIPSSGDSTGGTNAALGTVILSTSYRSTDSPPGSKVEMLNEYCTTESVPSGTFAHPIECDPKENPFAIQYVRTGEVPTTDSKMMYDLGVTYVATSGQQASNNVLGDLYVTYEIVLKKPIVASNVTSHFRMAYVNNSVGPYTTSNLFTSSAVSGTLAMSATGNVLSFPKGSVGGWLIVATLFLSPAVPAIDWTGAPALTNCAQGTVSSDGSSYLRTTIPTPGGMTNRVFYITQITVSDPAVVATITLPTALSGGSSFNVDRAQCIVSPASSIT